MHARKRKTQTKYNEVNPKHFNFFQAISVVPAGQVAAVGHKEEQLFMALAGATEQFMGDFNSHTHANTAWAFAAVRHEE